jgi:hypothetical protein
MAYQPLPITPCQMSGISVFFSVQETNLFIFQKAKSLG